jgi:hypothetical protein
MTSKPASERQYAYLTTLLNERDPAVTGVPDVAAFIQSLRDNGATSAQVSAIIKAVLALPKAAAPAGAAPAGRTNNYGAKCVKCGVYVPAGAGVITKNSAGKWDTTHVQPCPEVEAKLPTPDVSTLTEGVYVDEDGTVWKVYTGRQSGRLQAATLTNHGDHGTFEFVRGGLRMVADALVARTMRLLTQDEAAAFGRLNGFCCNCGLAIEDDRSVAAGYGPKCATNLGWWYPTYEEAAAILGRPVTKPSGVVVQPPAA